MGRTCRPLNAVTTIGYLAGMSALLSACVWGGLPGFLTSHLPPFPAPSRSVVLNLPTQNQWWSGCAQTRRDFLGWDQAPTSSQHLQQRTTVHGPVPSAEDNAERSAQFVYWADDRPCSPEAEGSWYSQRPVLLPSAACLATLGPQALRKSGRDREILGLGVLLDSTGGSSHPQGPGVW